MHDDDKLMEKNSTHINFPMPHQPFTGKQLIYIQKEHFNRFE